jgi:hypothetical protein
MKEGTGDILLFCPGHHTKKNASVTVATIQPVRAELYPLLIQEGVAEASQIILWERRNTTNVAGGKSITGESSVSLITRNFVKECPNIHNFIKL